MTMPLNQGLDALWDGLPPAQQVKFDNYLKTLTKWQKSINLVSPSTVGMARDRHVLDSYQLVQRIPDGVKTIYDLGSGAGFPALVIAIARPDLAIHCVESDQRKCEFLKTISRENDIPVTIHMGRIEEFGDLPPPDLITARALASLSQILSWTEFWRKTNPSLDYLLPKGATWQDEIKEAQAFYKFNAQIYPSLTDDSARLLLVDKIDK